MIIEINGILTDKIQDLTIKKEINKLDTLSFRGPREVIENSALESKIKFDGVSYIIKENSGGTVRAVLDVNDLRSKYIESMILTALKINDNMELLLDGTGWSAQGINSEDRRAFTFNNVNTYDAVMEMAKKYDFEVRFDTVNKIVHYAPTLGSDKGVYFAEDLNLDLYDVEEESYEFATRIEARGKDGMTFASINNGKSYLENFEYSDEIITFYWEDNRYTDKENLMTDAWSKLLKLSRPKKTYTIEVKDLASISEKYSILEFDIGDTVRIIGKSEEEHRIVSITKNLSNPAENTCTLSNKKTSLFDENKLLKEEVKEGFSRTEEHIAILDGKISLKVTKEEILTDPDIQAELKGDPGDDADPNYTWCRWADTPTSGISGNPLNKDYLGIAYNKPTPTPSDNYDDYDWVLVKGERGADGVSPDDKFFWVKYADDDKGTGMSDSPVGKRWLGVAENKDTLIESNDYRDYKWSPLYDNSVIMSTTAPSNPNVAQLWLDTSASPNLIKRWNGSEWETISDTTEIEELIVSKASQEDVDGQIANVVESIQTLLESEISQTNDTINFKFSEAIDAINAAGDRITDLSTEIETNIRFTSEGIEIGKTTSVITATFMNDRLAFYESGQEVAYFSNNKLYVTDIHVLTSLRIGNFAFFPRSNGNLSFRKVT